MNQNNSLPYSNLTNNYIEIKQNVKYCIDCDTKILSNQGFFNKSYQDNLQESITICGFCTNCRHHVLLSDCYDKVEIVQIPDNTIYFNYIYNEKSDQFILHNPMSINITKSKTKN
jgi:hypothetical protein